jgi:asparagine synthase (glutamine-hydrolysing)
MCGIAGFFNLDRAPVDAGIVSAMTDAIRHRGPDDQGFRLFSLASRSSADMVNRQRPAGVFEGALGFNRLKILDLSERGHQPMSNADGTVILAFNGEIYNAFDYKPELEAAGYCFRSRTDTEVILYLYERYGLDGMLNRLNGMFAIVIVDLRSSEVHIARDHFGIKPMYWAVAGKSVLFASEAKSFLCHPAFHARIVDERVDEYLAFRYIAGDDSLLEGVNQLRPGWCLRITPDGVSTRRYWQLPEARREEVQDHEAMQTLEQLLRTSVKSQLLSDVKVGCQFSGGIDSSIVSVFARTHFDADMDTFSVVFDDPRYTEERWMQQAGKVMRAVNHRFTFTSDYFLDTIAKASWHMDQPMGHPNSVGIWLLAQGAHEFVTVLLSGEGADEVFGGYTRFYYANLRPKVTPWLPLLRLVPGLGPRLMRQFGGDAADDFILASLFHQPAEIAALRPHAQFETVRARRHELFAEGQGDHLSNCLRYEMQTYLVDLLVRQDKMTMAHSMENRVPFLDRNLVDFSRRLPARLLASDTVALTDSRMRGTKVILKRLAAQVFSDEFVYRPKSGFSLPLSQFFRTPRFEEMMEDQLLPGMRGRGLVDADVVRARWTNLADQDQGGSESVWIAVALELWAQQFVDAGADRARRIAG